jgi:hypothetical protein
MSRILSFTFIMLFTPLLPSFFFFIGLKLNYIDFYGITEYYNVIFVDQMPWIIYWISGVVLATLFSFSSKKFAAIILIVLTLSSTLMFIPTIAHDLSKDLFSKEPFQIVKKPWTYKGTLLYEGRDNYYLLNEENQRVMTFKKDEIDEAY